MIGGFIQIEVRTPACYTGGITHQGGASNGTKRGKNRDYWSL
jgi:hypothetical protein